MRLSHTLLVMGLATSSTLLPSCKKDPNDPSNWECTDSSQCGEKQICTTGEHVCHDVACFASTDCALHQYCDTKRYACVEGCQTNADCAAGENCNAVAGSCQPYGCRSTQLDCDYGEFCNTATGQCYPADGQWCESCDQTHPCDRGDACIYYDNPQDSYCDLACNPNAADPCPRGFECMSVIIGVTKTWVCDANCSWLLENGYM
jgi:hypothetical protein